MTSLLPDGPVNDDDVTRLDVMARETEELGIENEYTTDDVERRRMVAVTTVATAMVRLSMTDMVI